MRLLIPLFFIGCATHVSLDVMEPAEINVPAPVQRLALVDRAPSAHSFQVLYGLRDALAEGPRFEVVANEAAQAAYAAGRATVGQSLGGLASAALCKKTGATGIVSLESVEVDDRWDWSERFEERSESQLLKREDGSSESVEVVKMVTVQQATLVLDSTSVWELLDCEGNSQDKHTVTLQQKRYGEGDTRADAQLNTGSVDRLQRAMMGDVSRAYRSRISPWNSMVTRRLFRGGNRDIRAGRKAAVAGDWSNAYKRWKATAKKGNSDSPRAWVNLAVLNERKGNLTIALKYARRAASAMNKGWVHAYVAKLEESIEKKTRLGEQLGPDSEDG
jgi:hypothetical protein